MWEENRQKRELLCRMWYGFCSKKLLSTQCVLINLFYLFCFYIIVSKLLGLCKKERKKNYYFLLFLERRIVEVDKTAMLTKTVNGKEVT